MAERADPKTCLHRVIESYPTFGGAVDYSCVSCDSDIPLEHWEGRVYKYLPQFQRWEQVGPSPRKRKRPEVAQITGQLQRLFDRRTVQFVIEPYESCYFRKGS